jgi:hypothetical protein
MDLISWIFVIRSQGREALPYREALIIPRELTIGMKVLVYLLPVDANYFCDKIHGVNTLTQYQS